MLSTTVLEDASFGDRITEKTYSCEKKTYRNFTEQRIKFKFSNRQWLTCHDSIGRYVVCTRAT